MIQIGKTVLIFHEVLVIYAINGLSCLVLSGWKSYFIKSIFYWFDTPTPRFYVVRATFTKLFINVWKLSKMDDKYITNLYFGSKKRVVNNLCFSLSVSGLTSPPFLNIYIFLMLEQHIGAVQHRAHGHTPLQRGHGTQIRHGKGSRKKKFLQ